MINAWKIPSRTAPWIVASTLVFCLALTQTALAEHVVLTASNTVVAYDGQSLERIATVPVGRFVRDIEVTPDGSGVFLATSGGVYGLDTENWSLQGPYTDRPVQNMQLSKDGSQLYVLDYEVRIDSPTDRTPEGFRTVTIDTATREVTPYATYASNVEDVVQTRSGSLYTLDFQKGQLFQTAEGSDAPGSIVDLGGSSHDAMPLYLRMIADGTRDRILIPEVADETRINVIDTATGATTTWTLPKGESFNARGSSLSPDGSRYYIVGLQRLAVLDGETGEVLEQGFLDGAFQQIAVSPEGDRLYSSAPVYAKGGGLAVINASDLSVERVIELADVSPYAIATLPR